MNALSSKDNASRRSAEIRAAVHDSPDELEDETGIEILPILNLLLRERYRILKPTAWVVLLALAYAMIQPPVYTATTKFLTAAASGSAIALPSAGSTAGGDAGSIVDTMPEYYEALVRSDDFLKLVVNDEAAKSKAGVTSNWLGVPGGIPIRDWIQPDDAVIALRGALAIASVKATQPRSPFVLSTTMELSATLSERKAAEALANAVLDSLSKYGGLHRNEKAIRNRDFIQSRLQDTEAELKRAEAALAEFSMRNRKIATPDIEAQKERLERAVKVQEEVFLTLRKQLEMAKIKVQENQALIQIIEHPEARKTGPKRARMVALPSLLALLFFGTLAYVRDRWRQLDQSDEHIQELMGNLQGIRSDLYRLAMRTRAIPVKAWRLANQGFGRLRKPN